jgi:precorrin-3B synthase
MPPTAESRVRPDRCPGALTVHIAADGGLARIRLPAGSISASALRSLARSANELGDGRLELTSRGNVQLRGLAPGAENELAERMAAAGLLPSASHERVRNIVASPLSGIDGIGQVDVAPLAAALDRELCGRPRLADLPGRFLFALDDGRGDVAALGADVTLFALPSDRFEVNPIGVELPESEAVRAALDVAEEFLIERRRAGTRAVGAAAWRIAELPEAGRPFIERMRLRFAAANAPLHAIAHVTPPARPAGAIAQPDGRFALVVQTPMGRLTTAQAEFLADHISDRDARITPWHSVVLPDLTDANSVAAAAEALGLGTTSVSPWYWVSACTGRPGCAKALADVQADAIAAVLSGEQEMRAVRWSGCERRCGRPHDTEVDLVATVNGYTRTEIGVS